ncbi:MAG: tetratricopeptide repeat protein, partial [Thermodesulfobacteriota bacterium]
MAQKDKILKKALKFVQKGNFDKAVAEYRSAIDMDSDDASVRLRLGDLYVKTGQLDEAVKEYTSAAKSNARRGFYLKAIAVYKRVLTIEKNTTDTHYKLAELYTKQRLIADAMSQYTIILNTFEQKGMDKEELDILQKMVQLDPSNLSIKHKLADMYRKLDFVDDAFNMYRLVCGKLFDAGNIKKAEDIYMELYENYPEEPRVLTGLVDIYREKGDEEELLAYSSRLMSHYVQSGELDDALEISKK